MQLTYLDSKEKSDIEILEEHCVTAKSSMETLGHDTFSPMVFMMIGTQPCLIVLTGVKRGGLLASVRKVVQAMQSQHGRASFVLVVNDAVCKATKAETVDQVLAERGPFNNLDLLEMGDPTVTEALFVSLYAPGYAGVIYHPYIYVDDRWEWGEKAVLTSEMDPTFSLSPWSFEALQ